MLYLHTKTKSQFDAEELALINDSKDDAEWFGDIGEIHENGEV